MGSFDDALARYVTDFGAPDPDDAARVRATLSDLLAGDAPAHRADLDATTVAVEAGVVGLIRRNEPAIRTAVDLLVGRGVAPDLAEATIERWSRALGIAVTVADPDKTRERSERNPDSTERSTRPRSLIGVGLAVAAALVAAAIAVALSSPGTGDGGTDRNLTTNPPIEETSTPLTGGGPERRDLTGDWLFTITSVSSCEGHPLCDMSELARSQELIKVAPDSIEITCSVSADCTFRFGPLDCSGDVGRRRRAATAPLLFDGSTWTVDIRRNDTCWTCDDFAFPQTWAFELEPSASHVDSEDDRWIVDGLVGTVAMTNPAVSSCPPANVSFGVELTRA